MPRYPRGQEPETLIQFLHGYRVDELKKLAGLAVIERLPNRKLELVDLLEKLLGEPANLRRLWGELDGLQREAVAETLHSATGRFQAARFRAKYGANPNWGNVNEWGTIKAPSLLCLFIHGDRVPVDMRPALVEFVPRPREATVQTEDAAPEAITRQFERYDPATGKRTEGTESIPVVSRETERTAARELLAVPRLIDVGKVRASQKTGRASASGADAIAAVLDGGDYYAPADDTDDDIKLLPMRPFAWPLLVQSAKLANVAGSKLQLTRAGRKALSQPPHEVLRAIWQAWLKTKLLDEFNRIDIIKGQTGRGKRAMSAPADRRAAIADALEACPPGRWIRIGELSRFMIASGRSFRVTDDPWPLYIVQQRYGSLGYGGCHTWEIVEERYMLAFLFEYAATLGIVDVAYIHPCGARTDFHGMWGADDLSFLSRYDGLVTVRINPLGAWCLGLAGQYVPSAPEASRVFKILPNLDVVAVEPPPPADTLFLDRIAQKTSDNVWKLDRARLLKALEQGDSVADIEAFLAAKSATGLPQTVAVFLKDMADRATSLTDRGSALLIEARDPVLAQLIANDARLRSLCMVAGERWIVVPGASESAFRRGLRDLGYVLPPRRGAGA